MLYPHSMENIPFPENFTKKSDYSKLEAITKQTLVNINGIQLNVNEAGPVDANKLIIFLHGFPETGLMNWKHQIVHFAMLGYRVIAPDQRGYNTSTKGDVSLINFERAVDDVSALISYYNFKKAFVVAHDWGGIVGWTFATTYPEKVEKLVVINIPHINAANKMAFSPQQLFKSLYIIYFQVERLVEWKLSNNDFGALIWFSFAKANPGTYSLDDLERYKKAWSQEGALTSMLNWYRYMFRKIFSGNSFSLPQTKVPTLILWGKNDQYLELSLVEMSVAKENCANCSYKIIEDATHWLPNEKPKEVCEHIEKFFKD